MTRHATKSPDYWVWVDCEMTGLDPARHCLLEIATIITEEAFDYLNSQVVRVTGANAPMPYAKNLERAKTAREAIQVMTSLVEEYGYASSGESFSIADTNEVWILEMVGRGKEQKGALWVAYKLPDGTIELRRYNNWTYYSDLRERMLQFLVEEDPVRQPGKAVVGGDLADRAEVGLLRDVCGHHPDYGASAAFHQPLLD